MHLAWHPTAGPGFRLGSLGIAATVQIIVKHLERGAGSWRHERSRSKTSPHVTSTIEGCWCHSRWHSRNVASRTSSHLGLPNVNNTVGFPGQPLGRVQSQAPVRAIARCLPVCLGFHTWLLLVSVILGGQVLGCYIPPCVAAHCIPFLTKKKPCNASTGHPRQVHHWLKVKCQLSSILGEAAETRCLLTPWSSCDCHGALNKTDLKLCCKGVYRPDAEQWCCCPQTETSSLLPLQADPGAASSVRSFFLAADRSGRALRDRFFIAGSAHGGLS